MSLLYGDPYSDYPLAGGDPWNTATPNYGTPTSTDTQQQAPVAQPAAQTGTSSSLFQPAYLGAPATVNPATIGTQQFSPQATIQQLLQGFAPQQQSAQNNLTQMLADFGVGGGQAVGAENQFQAQQSAALAPTIASAIQNSQGNTLSADTTNVGSVNSAANLNANDINSTNLTNTNIQNSAQQQLINDMLNQYYAQLGAFNQINTGGQGAANQNAVNYGQDITVQQDPFTQIFGALAGAGGQIGAAAVGKP